MAAITSDCVGNYCPGHLGEQQVHDRLDRALRSVLALCVILAASVHRVVRPAQPGRPRRASERVWPLRCVVVSVLCVCAAVTVRGPKAGRHVAQVHPRFGHVLLVRLAVRRGAQPGQAVVVDVDLERLD